MHDLVPVDARRPLTIEQAADLVFVSTWTIRRWIAAGYLQTFRSGHRIYLLEQAVLVCDRDRRRTARMRGGAPRTQSDN